METDPEIEVLMKFGPLIREAIVAFTLDIRYLSDIAEGARAYDRRREVMFEIMARKSQVPDSILTTPNELITLKPG